MIRVTTLAPLLLSAVVMTTTTTLAKKTTTSPTRPPFDLLTRETMEISLIAAQLASLARANETTYATGFDASRNISTHAHPDYEAIQFYDEEPDQAVLARKGGRCYVAFRTTMTRADWAQNLNIRSRDIYKDGDKTSNEKPCQVRAGYAQFIDTTRFPLAVEDVRRCVADLCDGGDTATTTNCLVVTGHSQGAATATVASILMYSLHPTVITFGQPITADPGCTYIPSQRMYRYVNFVATEHNKTSSRSNVTMIVDDVVLVPAAFSGSVHYGHFIAVGPDPRAVRYYGIDDNFTFGGTMHQGGFMPHTLGIEAGNHTYEARMMALLASARQSSSPIINAQGFSPGTLCEPGPLGDLCSQRCDHFTHRCAETLVSDLCVVDSCTASYECASGFCGGASACSAGTGLTTDGCPCSTDDDCASGSCAFHRCKNSNGGEAIATTTTRSPSAASSATTLRPAVSPATTPASAPLRPAAASPATKNVALSAAGSAGRSLDIVMMVAGLSIVWGTLCCVLL